VSKNQLKFANEERWRRLKNNQQWLKLNAMNKGVVGNKNKAAEIANSKAMMANKVFQEIIKNIKNGKLAVTARALWSRHELWRQPRGTQSCEICLVLRVLLTGTFKQLESKTRSNAALRRSCLADAFALPFPPP
jgi:hypothetical protein